MIIENDKINVEELKKLVPQMNWIYAPRVLSIKHTDHFYIGNFENDNKKVSITIRPSMRMEVKETYKNRVHNTGELPDPKKKYKLGELTDFGYYAQAVVETSFLDKVKELAVANKGKDTQKIGWS